MITTRSYAPNKQYLFKLIMTRYFKKGWWFFILFLFLGIVGLFGKNRDETFFGGFALAIAKILPIWNCLKVWRYLNSSSNRALLTMFIKWEFTAGSYMPIIVPAADRVYKE